MQVRVDQPAFLRSILEDARSGLLEDLALHRAELRDPADSGRHADAFRRLLEFLDDGRSPVDRDLIGPLAELARVTDEGNEYKRVVFEHEALSHFLELVRTSIGDNTLGL